MFEGLTISLLDLTASGLLGLGILMMFLGKLHTNYAYQAMERAYQTQCQASDKLRETNQIQARTIEKQNDIIYRQQVVGDVVAHTMEAIQSENKRHKETRSSHEQEI